MNENREFRNITEDFYQQPTLEVARNLLGNVLVHESSDGITSGIIVETEAYLGLEDRAAHSFGNRRTKRTEIMYHQPGYIYTYQMHGHCLLNIVSGKVGEPEAVLIRALEPLTGIEKMKERRNRMLLRELTSGPGKLCRAMGITMDAYGLPIFKQPLYILEGKKVTDYQSGPRIGIPNTKEARDYPYRFWIRGNPYVSR
jgi:DNA-3-methyladenine glycosylase